MAKNKATAGEKIAFTLDGNILTVMAPATTERKVMVAAAERCLVVARRWRRPSPIASAKLRGKKGGARC